MAESVDALVSNTSGAIRAGSIPALGTEKGSRRNSRTFFISGIYFATDAILSENFESFKMI